MKNLDISSFEKAINSLNSILDRYSRDNFDVDIRDAVIQRFEYTYSLAIKMLIKFINLQSNENIANLTFNESIRIANKMELIQSDLEKWTEYRQKRNLTSHTYDENTAKEVVAIIPEFKQVAEYLLSKLKEKLS